MTRFVVAGWDCHAEVTPDPVNERLAVIDEQASFSAIALPVFDGAGRQPSLPRSDGKPQVMPPGNLRTLA